MTGSLPAAARARLERFATAFDRLDAREYILYADTTADEERIHGALEEARRIVGSGPRRGAVADAIASARDAASRGYSRRWNLADTFLLYQTVPDNADDRARFLASLERAIVGVVLWDELPPDDLDVLLGPWAEMAARAAASVDPGRSGAVADLARDAEIES
jgi:hypothetical protein